MRYKKGNLVEVLDESKPPFGSRRCAEVVGKTGDDYVVRYNAQDTSGVFLEMVPKKSIRPCPPLVELSGRWAPGDVVEVFLNCTWRMAIVSKVMKKKHILVRLVGSSNEFKVENCNVRVRQLWKDGRWAIVGKDPTKNLTNTSRVRSIITKSRANPRGKHERKLHNINVPCIGFSRTRKRGLWTHTHPRREDDNGAKSDSANVCSSVGSCSGAATSPKFSVGPACDTDARESEGESVREEIHRLELRAYRATIEALYASGPLSWEQETLITNLRGYLNISNDEHSLELRNLISNASSSFSNVS
ncbi:unnamed protein product [Cuscuta campestris]|uniref:ENT domain-containing protein n=1 Tax=Cuscuta campestris TaxID=132261 RepID=A0A484LQD5_9ASTE|nr:unnamed protein product [Cuscuta campestris]